MADQLDRLRARIVNANAAMQAELARRYPEGKVVRCWIMHGQINASRGEVIGHPGGEHAYVLVRLHSKKEDVRHVPAGNIDT